MVRCEEEPLRKPVTLENYPPEEYVGDGKLPNLYWVSADHGYYYLFGNELIECSEIDGEGCYGKGGTIGVYETFDEALRVADSLFYSNEYSRVWIEDRLTGVIYEMFKYYMIHKGRTYDPDTGKVGENVYIIDTDNEYEEIWDDTQFTIEHLRECGYEFR